MSSVLSIIRRTSITQFNLSRKPTVLSETCFAKTSSPFRSLRQLCLNPRTAPVIVILVGCTPLAPTVLLRHVTLRATFGELEIDEVLPLQEDPLHLAFPSHFLGRAKVRRRHGPRSPRMMEIMATEVDRGHSSRVPPLISWTPLDISAHKGPVAIEDPVLVREVGVAQDETSLKSSLKIRRSIGAPLRELVEH